MNIFFIRNKKIKIDETFDEFKVRILNVAEINNNDKTIFKGLEEYNRKWQSLKEKLIDQNSYFNKSFKCISSENKIILEKKYLTMNSFRPRVILIFMKNNKGENIVKIKYSIQKSTIYFLIITEFILSLLTIKGGPIFIIPCFLFLLLWYFSGLLFFYINYFSTRKAIISLF